MAKWTDEASITMGKPGTAWLAHIWTASIAKHFEI